uniref:Uncharacterized protein n=1 Tax=Lygus hesperus TaxID=30085 RepID=A0A146MHH7_LYGHE
MHKTLSTHCNVFIDTGTSMQAVTTTYIPSARRELLQVYLEDIVPENTVTTVSCTHILAPQHFPQFESIRIGISLWDTYGRLSPIIWLPMGDALQRNRVVVSDVKVPSNQNTSPYIFYGDSNTLRYTITHSDIDIAANTYVLARLPKFWFPRDVYPQSVCTLQFQSIVSNNNLVTGSHAM